MKNGKFWANVACSLGVVFFTELVYRFVGDTLSAGFYPVIFLLGLIFLEMEDKLRKK